ncbi:N-formylglutamate amidohydrolase [Labrys sp. WJW]|uniref:N-formylglutamate amidohydrolase n=1 Tax=Labrys sp. WJW TaxID=1737983 RepID=UPI000835F0FD|nr:N-formylglutamate amidohydrolase [Labrys sp. WJW]OCC03386.1 N-formylglutamate amidohydrolase [Labrys sp. WJW]
MPNAPLQHEPALDNADWPPALEIVNEGGRSPIVLICEHASNHMPAEYGGLGLGPVDLGRHIAWDVGAAEVTRHLARLLDAPAFLAGYSRLLIDLNRPLRAPSSIPAVSEATVIPGNLDLDPAERERREAVMFHPFHQSVARFLDARQERGEGSVIVAIHSYTPVFHGKPRPWHAGVLFAQAAPMGRKVIEALRSAASGLLVEANVPYVIDGNDYAIPVHGDQRGNPAVLIEIRNDLIATPDGAERWAGYLAGAFSA